MRKQSQGPEGTHNTNALSWVDPRTNPRPPAPSPCWSPVTDLLEIQGLLTLCSTGRIYQIERWILAGKPLQATTYSTSRKRFASPMEIAIERDLHDVALLLLCNGYRLDLESHEFSTPLDQALQRRSWELAELLLEWGADPRKVDPESVFGTYRQGLMDRFWNSGLDFTSGHALAWHLSEHSSNRPLYGWTRRHREEPAIARELNMALLHAVHEEREKAVCLLLWAGADPRATVPELAWTSPSEGEDEDDRYSAIECAVSSNRGRLLPLLKPDPERDDFPSLYAAADGVEALEYLFGLQPPTDWSRAIMHHLNRLCWPFGRDEEAKACLGFIAKRGGRLGQLTREQCADLRRCLLKVPSETDVERLLRWMSDPECCEPATYAEVIRTPAMQRRLRRLSREGQRRRLSH